MSDTVRPERHLPFERMAAAIKDNAARDFGGAFVIVPPEGYAIEVLSLNSPADLAMFWGNVSAMAQRALNELQDGQRGYRR